MRAINYLGTISNPKFWQNYDKNTEEFKKNYSINSRSDTPEVGDARSRESMSAERVRIYQEAEKSGQTIGGTPYVPSRYANAEQIRADQLDALRQKTGQNIQDPALGQSQNLSAQEGAAILWGNRSPEETKHLYQQAVTPEGFGTIPYNPANPTTALNEMTKNAGGQWQMRDEGVLAEANGPYAVGTFKTETQRQQAVEALTSAGVLTLNGKQDDKAAIFIAGDELKNMTPEQLGTVQAILDEENKIQKGPALESRPITPSGPVGPSGP